MDIPPNTEQDALSLQRYHVFLNAVIEAGELWGLGLDDEWALTGDPQGNRAIPVWPDKESAAQCAQENWQKYLPRPVQLKDWLDDWVHNVLKDEILVVVHPTPESMGLVVNAQRLARELEASRT